MKNDIFISYSRHDTNVVNEIVAMLEQEGYSVWIDRDGIESGEDFKRVILKAIKESEVILFFSSEHSNASDWTAKEIGVAVKYRKHTIPIKLDDSNFNEAVEFDLINLDYIDYSKPTIRPAMREKLLKTLRNKLGLGSMEIERVESERKAKETMEMEKLESELKAEQQRAEAEDGRRSTTIMNESEIDGIEKPVENDFPKKSLQNTGVPEGALNGLFSISPTHKVYFSKGNLQYQASTRHWRFAEKQYDFIGKDNEKISSNYNGWIDSFGWGTGDNPTKSTIVNLLYRDFVSWGVNNIINGSDNQWSTLTSGGWEYLLEKRQTPSGLLYAKARVLSKTGLVLLPDNWQTGICTFNNPNCKNADLESNVFNASQWDELESSGAVFLPTAGMRTGHSMFGMRALGSYWVLDDVVRNRAISLFFNSTIVNPMDTTIKRSWGCSVRLVCYI